MKTIGLIGGTGWVSSVEYYRLLNLGVNKKLGGLEAARCILYSLNFGEIERASRNQDMESVFHLVSDAAKKLQDAKADGIAMCCNTFHLFAERLEKTLMLPLIHVGESTAKLIHRKGIKKVGLLGTTMTMKHGFYKAKLAEYGISVLVPCEPDQQYIHSCIVNELVKEEFNETSRKEFYRIIEDLTRSGAEGIVLGCTEIPLLLKQEDCFVPLYDTMRIHVDEIVNFVTG